MNQAIRLSTLKMDCESVVTQLSRRLTKMGLRVVRSFDLKSACASFTDLTCPHHGDAPCDCQLVVLLVYGFDSTPASVLLHSHRGITDVDLVDTPNNRPGKELARTIRLAFDTGVDPSIYLKAIPDVP